MATIFLFHSFPFFVGEKYVMYTKDGITYINSLKQGFANYSLYEPKFVNQILPMASFCRVHELMKVFHF